MNFSYHVTMVIFHDKDLTMTRGLANLSGFFSGGEDQDDVLEDHPSLDRGGGPQQLQNLCEVPLSRNQIKIFHY